MRNAYIYLFYPVFCGIWFRSKVFLEGGLGDHEDSSGADSASDLDAGASVLWTAGAGDSCSDRSGYCFSDKACV